MNRALSFAALLLTPALAATAQQVAEPSKSLTFHAAFDDKPDAAFAKGDGTLYHAPAIHQRDKAAPGLPAGGEVALAPGAGKFGGALKFAKSKGPIVFYKAKDNVPMPAPDWSGTVSFWLSTDPAKDLPDGFCDPVQLTSKQWDDAAFFVEFEKRSAGIPFRLGVYADKSVWNPAGRKFEEIPAAERPLITVARPPFAGDRWTHVAFTFSGFNTGKPNGSAALFLDGEKAGDLSPRTQTFTWDASKAAIMPGLSYAGLMDDLAVFNRALTTDEIRALFTLRNGVSDLTKR